MLDDREWPEVKNHEPRGGWTGMSLGWPRWNFIKIFGIRNTELCLRDGVFSRSERTSVCDRQTDVRQGRSVSRMSIASRGKKDNTGLVRWLMGGWCTVKLRVHCMTNRLRPPPIHQGLIHKRRRRFSGIFDFPSLMYTYVHFRLTPCPPPLVDVHSAWSWLTSHLVVLRHLTI